MPCDRGPADGWVYLVQVSMAGERWLLEDRVRRDRWLAEVLVGLHEDEPAAVVVVLPAAGRLAVGAP
jgi:hypothetical protein